MSQRSPRFRTLIFTLLFAVISAAVSSPAFAEEEPDPVPEQGTSCLLKVTQDADGIKAGLPALQVRLTQTSDDSASPVFEGTLLSLPLKVTLWRGMPAAEVDSAVATMKEEWDDLAAASLDGALDGELAQDEVESEESVDDPSDVVGQLETLAYRVQMGPLVEFGVKASGSVLGCVSDLISSLTSVTLVSPLLGVMSLPKADLPDSETTPAIFMGQTPNAASVPYLPNSEPLGGFMTTASAPSTTSVIRYRTFIPDATATAGPKPVCGKFRGDDRGFSSYYSKSARTRVSVFFDWPGRRITSTKNIGMTHRYEWGGWDEAEKRASDAGIKLSGHAMNTAKTYGKVKVNHAVANPLCSNSGPITYGLVWEGWKNGAARLRGTIRKVPNHEAYVYPKSGAYGETIFKREHYPFFCLNLGCGDETIDERD